MMVHNSENRRIVSSIKNMVDELTEPLESIHSIIRNFSPDFPDYDAQYIWRLSFIFIGGYLTRVDSNISQSEIDLIQDIISAIADDEDSSEFLDVVDQVANDESIDLEKVKLALIPINSLCMYDQLYGTNCAEKTRSMFFRFSNALLKSDGEISEDEKIALSEFKLLLDNQKGYSGEGVNEESGTIQLIEDEAPRPLDEILSDLNKLVGLNDVKRDVMEMVNFIKVQQMRQSRGMASVPISRHLVFYGKPGTGKTTVARLLAEIYKSLDIVSKGHLVETDRAGLVAGYIGQTAIKVKEVVTKALGGVLFVDEAYSLTGGDQDYGREAIDTLIKLMEDNRNDLIVVVAGYTSKMEQFLNSNPGLKSRFNKFFFFEDYDPLQLVEIFELFCGNSNFKLSIEARQKVFIIFQLLHSVRDESFGNARLARNIFERTVNNQANRIISNSNITEDILSTLEAIDIPGEIELGTIDGPKSVNIIETLADRNKLQTILVEALKKDPGNANNWLQLSDVVDKPEYIVDCLERVLKLDPDNSTVRQRLNKLRSHL